MLWDARGKPTPSSTVSKAHSDDANAVSWNPIDCNRIITGGSDCVVNMFDIRKLERPTGRVNLASSIINLAWSPHNSQIFAATDENSTIRLVKTSADYSVADTFVLHVGHRSPVVDIQWNPVFPWVLASVSDDSLDESKGGGGTMQVWRVNEFVEKDPDVEVEWAAGLAAQLGSRSRTNSIASSASNDGEE